MPILVVVVAAVGAGVYYLSRSKWEGGRSWAAFFTKGKDEGFSYKEIEILRNIAVKSNLEDPIALFWSQDQLDVCIRAIIRGIKMSGESEEWGTHDFLSKLYDYRKKIEMEKPKNKNGITNSRLIVEGQVLRVLVAGSGVFRSQVVKNTSQYMTISRPLNNKNSSMSDWEGARISIYFWRENDAGYVFDSDVEDEIFSKGVSSLKITHSDALFRTQKRRSVRVKMNKAAFLYLVHEGDSPNRLETQPGLKCFLEDISDTGCAVTVGGKADSGMRVKVQFSLDNAPICMTGTVRSTGFSEDTNRSVLRIEAENLPLATRNRILGEVFGMASDGEDEELPFRDLDEEAATIGAQSPAGNTAPQFAAFENADRADRERETADI